MFSSTVIGTNEERNICWGAVISIAKIDALIRHIGLRIEAIDTAYRSVKEQMATAFKECCQELGGKDADIFVGVPGRGSKISC